MVSFPVKIFDMGAPRCVRLRLHSEYSVSDGAVRIDDAVERARGARAPPPGPRGAARPHVAVETMAVPDVWPAGRFDLIVLSEVGYYLAPGALVHLRDMVVASLADEGELLSRHAEGAHLLAEPDQEHGSANERDDGGGDKEGTRVHHHS